MATFVDSDPLLGGPASMDRKGTKATTIIEGCSYTSIEGSLNI